jgi:hypothetical protein
MHIIFLTIFLFWLQAWLKEFAARLPEKEEVEEEVISTKEERLLALKNSTDQYGK